MMVVQRQVKVKSFDALWPKVCAHVASSRPTSSVAAAIYKLRTKPTYHTMDHDLNLTSTATYIRYQLRPNTRSCSASRAAVRAA